MTEVHTPSGAEAKLKELLEEARAQGLAVRPNILHASEMRATAVWDLEGGSQAFLEVTQEENGFRVEAEISHYPASRQVEVYEEATLFLFFRYLFFRAVSSQALGKRPSFASVQEYLSQHPDMAEVVDAAFNAARRQFPEAELSLEVYQDPEIDDPHLVLYVRLPRYDASVLGRIEEAERETLPMLQGKSGWLIITTDFRYPSFPVGVQERLEAVHTEMEEALRAKLGGVSEEVQQAYTEAVAVRLVTVKNAVHILGLWRDLLPNARIDPNPGGTLGIEWEIGDRYAYLEVGPTKFSLLVRVQGHTQLEVWDEVGGWSQEALVWLGKRVADLLVGTRGSANVLYKRGDNEGAFGD